MKIFRYDTRYFFLVIFSFLIIGGLIFLIINHFIFIGERKNEPKTQTEESKIDPLKKAIETKNYELCFETDEPDSCLRTIARISGDLKICKLITDKEKKEKCLALVASDTENYELCEEVTNNDIKNYCQKLLANQTLNINICEAISEELVPYPKEKCFFDIALAKKDVNLCEKTNKLKDSCYYQIATYNQNIDNCHLIKDNELRDFCFFYVSASTSQVHPCQKVAKDPLATLCPALASLNPVYCEVIQDDRIKNFCYHQIAFKTNKFELCKGDATCITKIAAKVNSPKLCEKIEIEQYTRDCKITVATTNLDESICTTLDENSKEYCFYYLALKTGEPDYCKNIPDRGDSPIYNIVLDILETSGKLTRNFCFLKVAISKPDINICNYISSDNGKRNCRINVLPHILDINTSPELCENLDSFDDKIECYYNTALNTGEYSLCFKIKELKTDPNYKKENWQLKEAEKMLRDCYERTLFFTENEYLKKWTSKKINGKVLPEDPIVEIVQERDTISYLAERALNKFLANTTIEEKEEIDFEITLGHKIYIEDYLAKKIKSERPIYPGEKIFFPRQLILEAIRISKKLTKEQLEELAKYSISTFEPAFEILQNGYLSYCDFQSELWYYYIPKDKEISRFFCQIALTQNYLLCESITEQALRGMCYEWIAENTSNYKICENFKEEDNKYFCYHNFAEALKDINVCDNISSTYSRDSCLFNIAQKDPKPSICELISEEVFKEGCYRLVALEKSDVSFCEKITSPNERTWCLIDLSKRIDDVSLCEMIKESSPAETEESKYECYISFYEKFPERFVQENCENLKEFFKDYCYLNKGVKEKNLNNCEKIKIKEIRNYCTYKVLVLNDDPRCELIEFLRYRNECYFTIAISTKNSLLCEKISENEFMKNECIREILNVSENKNL